MAAADSHWRTLLLNARLFSPAEGDLSHQGGAAAFVEEEGREVQERERDTRENFDNSGGNDRNEALRDDDDD